MALPSAELGLVVHYGFTWKGKDRRPPPDADKDRPCLIVDIREERGPDGRLVKRVIYLPISHTLPQAGEVAHIIGKNLARHLGLTAENSYLYTSYACEDDWPFDLAKIPGTAEFAYGFVPPKLFESIALEFAGRVEQVPDFVHRR